MYTALLALTFGMMCTLGGVILGRVVERRSAAEEMAEIDEFYSGNHDALALRYKHLSESYSGLAEQHRALLRTVQPRLANGRFGKLPRPSSNPGDHIG